MLAKALARFADWIRRLWAPGMAPLELYVATVILTLVSITAPGCAGSLENARGQSTLQASAATTERCEDLADRNVLYGGAAKAFAVLGGSAGLATIPAEDEQLQTGLAIGAAASAALAVGALYVAEQSGTQWARDCAAR